MNVSMSTHPDPWAVKPNGPPGPQGYVPPTHEELDRLFFDPTHPCATVAAKLAAGIPVDPRALGIRTAPPLAPVTPAPSPAPIADAAPLQPYVPVPRQLNPSELAYQAQMFAEQEQERARARARAKFGPRGGRLRPEPGTNPRGRPRFCAAAPRNQLRTTIAAELYLWLFEKAKSQGCSLGSVLDRVLQETKDREAPSNDAVPGSSSAPPQQGQG